MTVERMLTEEEPAGELVGRVLQEAGIEYVFGISGGHTGRIVSGLRKYQNSLRMVLVREESLAGVMAEVYGRLTRRPGVMIGQGPWVLGNGLIGTMEAFLSSSPMLLLTDFSDSTPFHLHAPYQQATGDYGSWDARRAFSGVTKQVMQAHTPTAAVQATQLAIKHALAGQAGPVAVLFAMDSLSGTVKPDSQPVLYPTRHYLPSPPPPADAARVAEAAMALLAAERPVVIAGNGVRIAQGYEQLARTGRGSRTTGGDDSGGQGVLCRNPQPGAGSFRHVRHRGGERVCSPKPTWCWPSARSWGRAIPRGKIAICSIRRGRPSSRSTSSRATHPGRSRPSMYCWAMPRRSCSNCTKRSVRMRPGAARPARLAWQSGANRRATSTRRATSPTIRRSCRNARSAS